MAGEGHQDSLVHCAEAGGMCQVEEAASAKVLRQSLLSPLEKEQEASVA